MPTRTKADERFEMLYEQLNPAQKQAVDAIEGPVMVVAGPGTGKTQVLAMRIANILRQTQMDPWNILCLTFTESGVAAMRQRLLAIIGSPAYHVRVHTFHGFANDILQDAPEFFSGTHTSTVVSDIERISIMREIVDGLSAHSPLKPFANPYFYCTDILSNIRDLKQENISPRSFTQLLERLRAFAGETQTVFAEFCALRPAARTHSECQAIHTRLGSAAVAAELPASLASLLEHVFVTYQEAAVSEEPRAASKARTAYKNALKRWWQQAITTLPKQQEVATAFQRYQSILRARGRVDFEDMIMRVVAALPKHDELLARYQEQFQYILVDEYQDTNGVQNELVRLLSSFSPAPNVFVVGDDKQSIYRFQGASLANMLQFYERHASDIKVISLNQNYRSHQTILDASHALISHNRESLARYIPGAAQELTAAHVAAQQPLELHAFSSPEAEDYFVARRVQSLVEQGVPPQEIAVLYRYNRDGEHVVRFLHRLGVPARLEMGEDALADPLVRQWVGLLTWLAGNASDEALAHILHYRWWRLPEVDTLRIIHWAGQHYHSILNVLASESLLKNAGVEKPTVFIQFAAQLAAWQAAATALPLPAFLEKLVVESHWLDQLLRHEEEAALRQVHTLLQAAVQLTHSNHNFRLADFVHHVALLREHNLPLLSQPWHSDEAAVRLMSAHRAKGLEFSHVFITRLNDRHWGNNRSGSRSLLPPGLVKYDYVLADSLEDERRLFYVALTRAKQGVVLTRAAHTATGTSTVPSRFVHELPSELIAVAAGSEEPLLDRVRTALVRPTPTADAKQYIQSLLQGYVMSVTHLNHYLECPRLFYVRDLLRLPMAPTRSLAVGAAVHESLRALFQELGDNGNVPKKSWVVARFVKALSRELLPEEEMKHAMARGRRIIGDYYDHYQQTLRPAALLEYNFAGHGVRIGNLPLTGKIDKVELLDAKQKLVNLVDYKTGRVEAGLKKLQPGGGLRRQLAFYHLLAQESPRFPYTIGSCEIDFVEPGPAGFTKKRVEIGQDEVEELRHSITRVWEEMKNLHFLRPEAGCGRATCVYCA